MKHNLHQMRRYHQRQNRRYRAAVKWARRENEWRERCLRDPQCYEYPPRTTVVRCRCGEPMVCSSREFTNTCEVCGADFDGQGHKLAPRNQWGWETGETYADIVRPGDPWEDE